MDFLVSILSHFTVQRLSARQDEPRLAMAMALQDSRLRLWASGSSISRHLTDLASAW